MASAFYANVEQISHADALDLQKELAVMRKLGNLSQDIVIFANHAPTIALGRNKEFSAEFLETLKKNNQTHQQHLSERGFDLHNHNLQNSYYIGSGQFNAYLVNDYTKMLNKHDLSGYNRLLNRVILHTVRQFGIDAKEKHASIVFNDNILAAKSVTLSDKIAFSGVQIHLNKESAKHSSILNSGPIISLEEIIGIEPLADDIRSAFLSSMKKNMGYSHIDEVQIYHNKATGLKINKV